MSELIQVVELPNLANVGKGQTAILGIPVGNISYHAIGFELSGVTKAQITDIEVNVNGSTMQEFDSGEELEILTKFYKRSLSPNELVIPFRRSEFESPNDADMYGFGMADVATFQIRFDISPEATNPVIKAYAVQAMGNVNGGPRLLGAITKVKRHVFPSTGQGLIEIDSIPKLNFIQAIHILNPDINKLEVRANNTVIYSATKERGENIQVGFNGTRDPQKTKAVHIDWMLKNTTGGQLPVIGLHDFRLRLDMKKAGQVPILVEYLDGFSGG